MRYLTPNYWQNLNSKNTNRNDGLAFENLVSDILNIEYGNGVWKDTGQSWDGSKDFWFLSKEKRLWAECKNYKKNISLNVLSSTLVMAQIEDVDEILLFSYSSLTKPVYEKISKFADSSNKIIRIYDDEALENLILFHGKDLLPKYFPEFSFASIKFELSNPTIICSVIRDPLLAYSTEDEHRLIPNSPGIIDFNTIFCIYISIYNKNKDNLEVTIEYDWKKDSHLFEVLRVSSNDFKFEIPSYSIRSRKLYLRVVNYKNKVELPYVTVKTCCGARKFKQQIFKFKTANCNWLGDTILIGQSYYNLLKRFTSQVINRKRFSALHIYGRSGVGKSRIINEAVALGLKNGYRIIKFNIEHSLIGNTVNTTKWLIKELIYALYNIPDLDSEIDYEYINKYKDHNPLFELLKCINAIDSDFDNKIEQYVITIAEKLCSTRCFLVIDNIQYYPESFIYLLAQAFSYSIVRNKRCLFVAVVSFNTCQMVSKSKAMDLHLLFKQYEKNSTSIVSWHLSGFTERNEARVYFNQLLSNSINLREKYIEKFIDRTANNPYYIKATLNWLEINGWVKCSANGYDVINYSELYKGIDMLPDNIEDIISKNWHFFIGYNNGSDSYLLILSIIHFYGKLDWNLMQKFNINEEAIKELENHEFIKKGKREHKEYYFHHDIIEDYFCKHHYPLSNIAAKQCILLDIKNSNAVIQQKYVELIQLLENTSLKDNTCYYSHIDNVPSKWRSEYLDLLMRFHVKYLQNEDRTHWIELSTSLCAKIREIEGTQEALISFDEIYTLLRLEEDSFQRISFGWFCISYCNVLYEANRVDDAIHCIIDYSKRHHWNTNDYEENKVRGYVLNRLHVYSRYNVNIPLKNKEIMKLLEESDKISHIHNDDEIKYINLIDYAHCVYAGIEYKQYLLAYLNQACKLYEIGNIPQKTMNHIQTQIIIALIECDTSKAIELCEYGINYAIYGQHAYYKGYFTEKFYLYLASAYLMQKDILNAENAIMEAIEIDSIISLRVQWIILWLQSIKCYLTNEFVDSLTYLEQAYKALQKSTKRTFKKVFLQHLCSNYRIIAAECYKSTQSIPSVTIPFLKIHYKEILCLPQENIEHYIDTIKGNSVISSLDKRINFPCF